MAPMLSVAVRPRNLGILALMVAATVVCGLLANWQWDRAQRARAATEITQSTESVSLAQVMGEGEVVTNAMQGRLVSVTGQYQPDSQVIVPGRRLDGTDATIILTDFLITDGELAGTHVPIARGWMPAVDAPTADAADIPPVPTGTQTVVGRLEASEAASGGFTAPGELAEIASPLLTNEWGAPMIGGYLAVTADADADPANTVTQPPELRVLPAASSEFTRGLDLQNIAYMIQWIVFGGFFLYIWYRAVRTQYLDEQHERRERLLALAEEGASGGTGSAASDSAVTGAPDSAAQDVAASDSAVTGAPGPASTATDSSTTTDKDTP